MQYNRYTDNLKTAVFDIETMGLSAGNDMIISASFCDEDGSGLRQYFCDDPNSEYLLITKIIDELNSLDAIITYNGERFDVPFVITRAKKYGIGDDFPSVWNIDIYKYLKGYWMAGKLLPSLSQKSVEEALGLSIARTDEIGGAECITLYNQFMISGKEECRDKILLHNADDVRQLAKIADNLSFLPFHKIVYETGHSIKARENYPGASDFMIRIDPCIEKLNSFTFNAHTISGMLPMSVFEEYFSLEYDSFSGAARLELAAKEIDDYLYVDLSAMPVNIKDYEGLEGFSNNYLILKQGKDIKYKEINILAEDLLGRIA